MDRGENRGTEEGSYSQGAQPSHQSLRGARLLRMGPNWHSRAPGGPPLRSH